LGPRVERVLGRSGSFVLKRASAHELGLYRSWLSPAATGAPALLGAVRWPDGGVWLALQDLPEAHPDLATHSQVVLVFEHLAGLHRRFLGTPAPGAPGPIAPAALPRLAAGLRPSAAMTALWRSPVRTLVHGDYHRGNLVLHDGRVRVLDWEHGGGGHPVWDLVLLAPEQRTGWDGVPSAGLAEMALQVYHRAGPLAHMPWPDFLAMQQAARLGAALRREALHRRRAAAAPPGPMAAVILAEAQAEAERVRRLRAMLGV